MSNYWSDLLQTALLGTERNAVDAAGLPISLQIPLAADKETHLLQTAALAWQYRQAGELVPEIKPASSSHSGEETLPYASEAADAVLKQLLEPETDYHALLVEWCRKCGARQWLVRPERLTALLEKGRDKAFSAHLSVVRQVIGRRGVWLAAHNPAWHYILPEKAVQAWHEGKSGERKAALEKLRMQDPNLARTLLEDGWPSETPKTRADLLPLLEKGLSMDDEPFLQRIYDECVVLRRKKPDAGSETFLRTVDMLLSLPGSALSRYLWEAMKTVLPARPSAATEGKNVWQKMKKMLPGAAPLPADNRVVNHEVLQPQTLREQFGWQVDEATFQPIHAVQAHVASLPPGKWTDFWRTDINTALVAFDKTYDCLEAVLEAVARYGAADWAEAAAKLAENKKISRGSVANRLPMLLPLLQAETAERMYRNWSGAATDPTEWRKALLARKGHLWSEPFTRHLCREITTAGGSFRQHAWFFDQALLHVPMSLTADTLSVYAESAQPWTRNDWQRQVAGPLLHGLLLRGAMEKAFG